MICGGPESNSWCPAPQVRLCLLADDPIPATLQYVGQRNEFAVWPRDNAMKPCQLVWNPGTDRELTLRIRPLREQWEARGPGILRYCQKRMPWLQLPPQVEIQLMLPQRGGAGHVMDSQTIALEAVLANRYPQLPEVVRLAWLILCASDKKSDVRYAALVPVVLAAAEFVELARCDADTLRLALADWLDCRAAERSDEWFRWWQEVGQNACDAAETWQRALETHGFDGKKVEGTMHGKLPS